MNKREPIPFIKLTAAGNDFVLVDNRGQITEDRRQKMVGRKLPQLAKKMCDRKYGAGADGLLVIETSRRAAARMRIFNPDGSEAEMCGNGARCAMLWVSPRQHYPVQKPQITLQTKAGLLAGKVSGRDPIVRIKMTAPFGMRLRIPLRIGKQTLHVHYLNTGVPHTVVFVEGLSKINVGTLGRAIRYHPKFAPSGTNVNFVEILSDTAMAMRTYERGVEDETLACGTGAVASALLSSLSGAIAKRTENKVEVKTAGNEILRVYFRYLAGQVDDVWLEGKAQIVYRGEYYV